MVKILSSGRKKSRRAPNSKSGRKALKELKLEEKKNRNLQLATNQRNLEANVKLVCYETDPSIAKIDGRHVLSLGLCVSKEFVDDELDPDGDETYSFYQGVVAKIIDQKYQVVYDDGDFETIARSELEQILCGVDFKSLSVQRKFVILHYVNHLAEEEEEEEEEEEAMRIETDVVENVTLGHASNDAKRSIKLK